MGAGSPALIGTAPRGCGALGKPIHAWITLKNKTLGPTSITTDRGYFLNVFAKDADGKVLWSMLPTGDPPFVIPFAVSGAWTYFDYFSSWDIGAVPKGPYRLVGSVGSTDPRVPPDGVILLVIE